MKMYFIAVLFLSVMNVGSAFGNIKTERFKVEATEEGFKPETIKAKAGTRVILEVTRTTDSTCATSIQVPEKKINENLKLNIKRDIDLGILKKGDINFACGMNMLKGVVKVE